MLLLRCSFPAVSISRSMSFWPSTIATRNSSVWVALNNMRFIFCSPALTFHGEDKPCGAVTALGLTGFPSSDNSWVEEDDSCLCLRFVYIFILQSAGLWNPLECCERAMHQLPSLLFRVSELNPSRRRRIGGSSKRGGAPHTARPYKLHRVAFGCIV